MKIWYAWAEMLDNPSIIATSIKTTPDKNVECRGLVELAEYEKLKEKFKSCLGILDTLMEEARSLRDTESIELESLSVAEELVIILSRTEAEELAARKASENDQPKART